MKRAVLLHDPVFSDSTLILDPQTYLHISRFALSKHSGFFTDLFIQNPDQKKFYLDLPDPQKNALKLLVEHIYTYTDTHSPPINDKLSVYQAAFLFDIPTVFKWFGDDDNLTIEELSNLFQYLEQLKEHGAAIHTQKRTAEQISNSTSVKEFRERATRILRSKFKTMTDIQDKKKRIFKLTRSSRRNNSQK